MTLKINSEDLNLKKYVLDYTNMFVINLLKAINDLKQENDSTTPPTGTPTTPPTVTPQQPPTGGLPDIDIGDGISDAGTRPAEVENFDLLAKKKYDANPHAKKKYNDLSHEYRRKLRYAAMADFQRRTGKPPYKQVKGDMTFADYLKSQSVSFQREWLGKTRFELFQSGKLSLDQMVHPDRGFKRTITELRKIVR